MSVDDNVPSDRKSPGFWFYPADYERDVQILSLSAQGLWVRILCWMSDNEFHRGFAELPTGDPMTQSDIAARAGKPLEEVASALAEMRRIGVFSEDDRGCILCRRMARDTHISNVRKAAAKSRMEKAVRASNGTFAGRLSENLVDQNSRVNSTLMDSNHIHEHDSVERAIENTRYTKATVLNVLSKNTILVDQNSRSQPTVTASASASASVEEPLLLPKPGKTNGYNPTAGWKKFKSLYPANKFDEFMVSRIWIGIVETQSVEDLILSRLPKFVTCEQWTKDDGKFIPLASNFLGKRVFEMDPGPDTKGPNGKGPKVLEEWKPGMEFKPGMTIDRSLIKPWDPFAEFPKEPSEPQPENKA